MMLFLVKRARLVPEHFLPEQGHEFIDLRPPELRGQDKTVKMIGHTIECLVGRERKVPFKMEQVHDEAVAELGYHGEKVLGIDKKVSKGRVNSLRFR